MEMKEKMGDDILAINRMFVECNKCGKKSDWVVEFAATSGDFWYQPVMTCGECYSQDLIETEDKQK